jgi:hypothetical protein
MRLWQTLLEAPWSRDEAGVVNSWDRLQSLPQVLQAHFEAPLLMYLVPFTTLTEASDQMEDQLKSLAVILFKEAEQESAHHLKKGPEAPQAQARSEGAEDVEVTLKGLPATLTLDLDESFLSAVHIDVQFDHEGKAYEVKLVIQPRD